MFNKALKKAKDNKKGFTLAELLIVVAIIAVLVAISIPIFTSQLEKSRESTDAANLRAAYAEVMTASLTQADDVTGVKRTGDKAGEYVYTAEVAATQTVADWQNKSIEDIGGTKIANIPAVLKGNSWTITYTESTGAVAFAQK